jgi:ubiquinone/menaquinone biosynthesis C-methylase UbiE
MVRLEQLVERLNTLDKISNEEWIAKLNERKLQELEFHDFHRDENQIKSLDKDTYEKLYGNAKYYQATGRSRAYVENWIDTYAKNKIFLDYACGNGSLAIRAAKAGAKQSIGIDLSSVSISNARKNAAQEHLSEQTFFVQADCENTGLPDESIDVVICSGMLHHLDLSYAFPELRRILAPGGRILCVEALDYNPLIKLYRYFTPEMRTQWEKAHILDLSDIEFAKRFFDIGTIKYWHILSIIAPKISMSLLPLLDSADTIITKIPFVQLMAWIFTFELLKPKY